MFTPPDDYYLNWPVRTHPTDLIGTYHLKSLTPREALSGSLIQRSASLAANSRFRAAAEACAWANELAPHHRLHRVTLSRLLAKWRDRLSRDLPPPRPHLEIVGQPPRQFAALPDYVEREIVRLTVLWDLSRLPEFRGAYHRPFPRCPQTGLPPGIPNRVAVRCPTTFWEEGRQLRKL